mgnify:CR=1 FL=1
MDGWTESGLTLASCSLMNTVYRPLHPVEIYSLFYPNLHIPVVQNVYTQYMVTKTINIRESAYEALKSMKREGESFSDVILRLSREDRKKVTDFVRSLPPEVREDLASSVIKVKKELDTAHPKEVPL